MFLSPREGQLSWRIPFRGPRDKYLFVRGLLGLRAGGETKMRFLSFVSSTGSFCPLVHIATSIFRLEELHSCLIDQSQVTKVVGFDHRGASPVPPACSPARPL